MFKKFVLSATLALTLAGGALTTVATTPVAAAPATTEQALPAGQSGAAVQAPAEAVQLSIAQMADVQGDGWWSKFKKWVKKVVKKVVGVIVQEIIEAIKDWLEEYLSGTSGGEKQQQEESTVQHYNSQADYDAGNVSSTTYEDTGMYQTEVWYGDCYCSQGGTREGYYDQPMMMY
jgi:hypothetical protein